MFEMKRERMSMYAGMRCFMVLMLEIINEFNFSRISWIVALKNSLSELKLVFNKKISYFLLGIWTAKWMSSSRGSKIWLNISFQNSSSNSSLHKFRILKKTLKLFSWIPFLFSIIKFVRLVSIGNHSPFITECLSLASSGYPPSFSIPVFPFFLSS